MEECKDNEVRLILADKVQEGNDAIYYKDLNSKTVNKLFRVFGLWSIGSFDSENEIVQFQVRPSIINYLLWDDYRCGFYYTKTDNAIDVFWSFDECDEEIESASCPWGKYWYRTEQIDDNLWYYECKILERFYVKR